MTTQPSTKCDRDLYESGHVVCIGHGPSTAIEAIVVRVRETLGIRLDWHYAGGRCVVLTEKEEDVTRARRAMFDNRVVFYGDQDRAPE